MNGPKDYTQTYRQNGTTTSGGTSRAPDEKMHLPPIVLFGIGGIGVLAGFAANGWQVVTTFIAFWQMFTPGSKPVDFGRQPVIFLICGLIAFSFQMALIYLVFRIDSAWKHRQSGGGKGKATAIEIVQHIDIFMIWSLLGFVVDTIGDYTFISIYTAGNGDPSTAMFLTFMYATALYALSTIAFVRSWEYIWAGFSALERNQKGHKDA